MDNPNYNRTYFEKSLQRGKILKKMHGDKWLQYAYWKSYFSRNLGLHKQILEVGCGLGFFGRYVHNEFRYFGLDISIDAIVIAKQFQGLTNVFVGDARSLPFKNNSFLSIIAFDMVEHLQNPILFIQEAYRIIEEGGKIVITTPNVRSFGVRIKSRSIALKPSMVTDLTHISLIHREGWIKMIEDAGFKIRRCGTDCLWDIPYFKNVPQIFQKLLLIPFNMIIFRFFGSLNWMLGENLVIVAEK